MNNTLRTATCLVLAWAALPAFVAAQTKHTPTVQEALSLKSIGDPKISPDGRLVAYQVQTADWKGNEFVRQIWLINVETGRSFQLTRGKKSAGGAQWSPDGRWLAFVTEREPLDLELTPPAGKAEEKREEQKEEKKEEQKEVEKKERRKERA